MNSRRKDTHLYPNDIKIPHQFPSISKPQIIGHFSVDKERKFEETTSECKYLTNIDYQKRVRIDLNQGYENVIRKIESARDERIEHLLLFISKNLTKLRNQKGDPAKLLSTEFVCFRGLLRILMCTPYEYREPWTIVASKFKGTIYLWAPETEKRKNDRATETDMQKRILSYGFKFEQYMLTGG